MASSDFNLHEPVNSFRNYEIATYTQSNLFTATTDGYLWRRYDSFNITVAIWLYDNQGATFTYFNEARMANQPDTFAPIFIKRGTKIGSNFVSQGATGSIRFVSMN